MKVKDIERMKSNYWAFFLHNPFNYVPQQQTTFTINGWGAVDNGVNRQFNRVGNLIE